MEFNIDAIVQSIESNTTKGVYKKRKSKVTKKVVRYKPMTAAQIEQRDADLRYLKNWRESNRMPRAKSQRIADLNNRYFNS